MDLMYPARVQQSLDRLGQALAPVSASDEIAACGREPELWGPETPSHEAPELTSPLTQVTDYRKLGEYALPLGELLRRTERQYVPVSREWSRAGVMPLGWPDARAPWDAGAALAVEFNAGKLRGQVSVAPLCVPANELVLLARKKDEVVLVRAMREGSRVKRVGDAFSVAFDEAPAVLLTEGADARAAWERLAIWERLGLLGLTLGLIDRAWRIALDALCAGKRDGNMLADEQVAQFQLSDIHIDRLAAEHLALDVAIDAERGRAFGVKLAIARYYTSSQAERCAARALHLAALFLPRSVPVAHWLVQRAHFLSVFSMAREHEVRVASAGLAAGMSLE